MRDRTQLLELIDFCRQNKTKVQALVVWKIDRFARNVADHFSVKATLMKYGVRIMSVTEPIDTNPEGKLMETILAGFAQFDNDVRAMRTVQGMRRRLQEGIFPWKPPLGYRNPTNNGGKKTQPDQPDQPQFGQLQKTWREFASEAYTKAEIRRLMASWGVVTESGSPISAQFIDRLFSNRYYAGVLIDPWSDEEYLGRHVPMVTIEEFAQVQQIIAKRNRSVPHRKERSEFPLRGVIRCGTCLRYMTGSFSRGRSQRYPYYHCCNRQCERRSKGFAVDAVNGEFEAFLTELAPNPKLLPRIQELLLEVARERLASGMARKARRKTEVTKLDQEVQELIKMRATGLITDEEFVQEKSRRLDRRFALEGTRIEETLNTHRLKQELDNIC